MTEHWVFPVFLSITMCVALVLASAVSGALRRNIGDRRRDILGGVALLVLMAYLAIGVGMVFYMALSQFVAEDDIAYDQREFVR